MSLRGDSLSRSVATFTGLGSDAYIDYAGVTSERFHAATNGGPGSDGGAGGTGSGGAIASPGRVLSCTLSDNAAIGGSGGQGGNGGSGGWGLSRPYSWPDSLVFMLDSGGGGNGGNGGSGGGASGGGILGAALIQGGSITGNSAVGGGPGFPGNPGGPGSPGSTGDQQGNLGAMGAPGQLGGWTGGSGGGIATSSASGPFLVIVNASVTGNTADGGPSDIAEPAVALQQQGFRYDRARHLFVQPITVTNVGSVPLAGPLSLALDGLAAGITLTNATGTTTAASPTAGLPYIDVTAAGATLDPGQGVTILLSFADPTLAQIGYIPTVLGPGPR
ncbi:MAG TPA: hypothetical protein VG406_04455 [Isosphaeraceae bacterium]|jgi:hypothetical protein|nr:hypothetical protein [Isosphaeraceae bacterium]